jgi:hypothetical protein
METFALVVLLASASPCSPVPPLAEPWMRDAFRHQRGPRQKRVRAKLAATLKENPGAEVYCLRR